MTIQEMNSLKSQYPDQYDEIINLMGFCDKNDYSDVISTLKLIKTAINGVRVRDLIGCIFDPKFVFVSFLWIDIGSEYADTICFDVKYREFCFTNIFDLIKENAHLFVEEPVKENYDIDR